MKNLIKQLGIVIFVGTMLMILAMQSYLGTRSTIRNHHVLRSKLKILHGEEYQNLKHKERVFATTENSKTTDVQGKSSNAADAHTNYLSTEISHYTEDREIQLVNDSKHELYEAADKENFQGRQSKTQPEEDSENSHYKLDRGDRTKICPEMPPGLVGVLNVNASYEPSMEEAIAAGGPVVDGCYEPNWCTSRQNVAVIIPYKDRLRHLITLMYHLHPILQRQAVRYCIFVAEQFDNGAFNKARVMNAAFKEITTNHPIKFDCVIFHDVDMLLEDDRNIHMCAEMPKHLSPAIDKFNYTLNYGTIFGGVTAISVKNYQKANGHSNNFWGWGGEDNDMEKRISRSNLTIKVTNTTYGRYKMIPHEHPWWFSPLYGVGSYLQSKKHWSVRGVDDSGLRDIRYSLRFTTQHRLWKKLTVDIRTIVVEKAIVRFRGYSNIGQLEFTSPSYKTEQHYSILAQNGSATPPEEEKCDYAVFHNKTVNKTLGLVVKERLKYGRMYNSLEEAKRLCNSMHTFCGSIVEEHPGKFSLRATAYMHENYLKYRSGMVKQHEVTEIHKTLSVHVKTCADSSSYLNFFLKPVVMSGDAKHGPAPAYDVEFKIRMFFDLNTTLYYTGDIMTAHKAMLLEKADVGIPEVETWDTMGNVYSSKSKVLNTSDPKSLERSLPKGFTSIEALVAKGDGIISVRTPVSGLLRHPGCYVCRSTLSDENGAALLQWKWWFELRAQSQEIEDEILERTLEKAKIANVDLADTVEKRRQMWLSYHEKLKSIGDKNQRGVPDRVLELVRKASHQDNEA